MGLIFKWQSEFEADTKPCYDSNGNNNRLAKEKTKHKSPLARLSLGNLGGAFAVLRRRNSHFCPGLSSGNVAQIVMPNELKC